MYEFRKTLVAIALFGFVSGSPITVYNSNWSSGSDLSGLTSGHAGLDSVADHEAQALSLSDVAASSYGSGNTGSYHVAQEEKSGGDSGASESQSGGGDFHKGLSIVGAGGGAKGHQVSFDLTHHGGDDHVGLYGGSFVSSGKHELDEGGHVSLGGGASASGGHLSLGGGAQSSGSHLDHLGLGAYGDSGHQLALSGHF